MRTRLSSKFVFDSETPAQPEVAFLGRRAGVHDLHDTRAHVAGEPADGLRRILVERPLVHNRNPKTSRKSSDFLVMLHVEAEDIARELFDVATFAADIAVAENLLLIRQDVLLQRVVEVQQEIQLEARVRHRNLGNPGEHAEVGRIALGVALVHVGIEEHDNADQL